jgi:hypothetical protein
MSSALGVLENAYAFKVEENVDTLGTITNKWGVYQEGANDLNYFLAPTGMGGLPIPNAMLKVSKDTVSTQETFGIQVSNSSSNSNAGANGTNYGIYSNTQNQGTGSAVGIYSSINNGEADNFNIQAVSTFTKNTGTAVGISHGSTVNNDGGTTTVTRLREFEILSSTGSGTVTNHYSLYSGGAGITNTANAFHIYLNGHAQGTLKYGIYQEGASDLNYFNASTGIGVDPKDSEAKFTSVSLLTSDANDNPAIYGLNRSATSFCTGIHGAVGTSINTPDDISLPSEGLVALYGQVAGGTVSTGTSIGLRTSVADLSSTSNGAFGIQNTLSYAGVKSTVNHYGISNQVVISGDTTEMNFAYGSYNQIRTTGTATIESAFGLYVGFDSIGSSPSVTNTYGLYIEQSNATYNGGATNIWGIFQSGTGLNELGGELKVTNQIYSAQATTIQVALNVAIFDGTNGNSQPLDLANATGDINLTFTNLKAGGTYFIPVTQKSSSPYNIGTYTVTGGTVKFPSGTAPTISTGASAIDTLVVYFDGTDCLVNFSQNYS